MTDKVQKIKDWISKEQDGLMDAQGNFEYPEHEGAYHILCNLDAYIDSLQEEPVSKEIGDYDHKAVMESLCPQLKEEPTIPDIVDEHFWKMLEEEPVKPSVDEAMAEIERKAKLFTEANKGRTSEEILVEMRGEEPVSEDLEDIASQLSQKYFPDEYNIWARPNIEARDCKNACIEMAKWQKENLWKPADGDDLPDIDREVIALLDNGKVVFAHRPPEYWDGKDIITGKVTRNYPKTYGKGGWNIPDVKYWLDVELPKEIEL